MFTLVDERHGPCINDEPHEKHILQQRPCHDSLTRLCVCLATRLDTNRALETFKFQLKRVKWCYLSKETLNWHFG